MAGRHPYAIDSQASARELVSCLEICDLAMMNILFLFAQKLCRNGVKRMGLKFVLTEDDLPHIELNAALNVDRHYGSGIVKFRANCCRLHFCFCKNSAYFGIVFDT